MRNFTVFDPATGRILRSGQCQDHMLEAQAGDFAVIEAVANPETQMVDVSSMQVIDKPPVCQEPHYSLRRVQEYPSIGEQLDVIWKQIRQMPHCQEAHDMLARIDAVKKANPKP